MMKLGQTKNPTDLIKNSDFGTAAQISSAPIHKNS
jgi:hypothetical protein